MKTVKILMATYNGQKYIAEQLDSLAAQTYENWQLIASDDGSTDDTVQILRIYQELWGAEKIQIRLRSKADFVENFLSMVCDPAIQGDYYAFCDQDDVWFPQKLAIAVDHLENLDTAIPLLYCGRTAYVHDDLKPYSYSPNFIFPKSFRNALVQCIAGGNTMVFNQPTKNMLEQIGLVSTPSHDWWLYQLVTGAGGYVYYDSTPYIFYRQHSGALIGGNVGILAKIKRIFQVFNGRFLNYSDQNIRSLESGYKFLTHDNKKILDLFKIMRSAKLKDRFRLLEICGLYRQTWRGTVSLICAAIFKKI